MERMHHAETWDASVGEYEAWGEPFTRQIAEAAMIACGGVKAGEDILDVAAGTGALALAAARKGAHVLAIDFSPGMVARLTARFCEEGFEATSAALVMDGQRLDLDDGAFDAAFSIFGVFLFSDPLRGMAEMARVLRPGGRAVVTAWADAGGAGPWLAMKRALDACFPGRFETAFPPGPARLSNADILASEMRRAGFADVTMHSASSVWTASSAQWVVDNADRLFRNHPAHLELDAPDRDGLRATLYAQLTDEFGGGAVAIESAAHIAVGRV